MFTKQKHNLKKDILQNFNQKNMKLKQLISGADSLGMLSGLKLPIVVSFKISLFIKKASPELEEYNKKRNELLKDFAEPLKDEDGKDTDQMKFKDEDAIKEFNKQIEELAEQEISVEVPDINISEFAGIEIEPKHLVNLDWLIKA